MAASAGVIWEGMLCQIKGASSVKIHEPIPVVHGLVFKWGVDRKSCIVHQDIYATKLPDSGFD